MTGRRGGCTAREVTRALQRAGFTVIRQTSAHCFLRKPGSRAVCVPVHPGRTLPTGTLGRILRQSGMTAEEFEQWQRKG